MSTLYVISPPLEIFEGLKPEVRQRIVPLPDFCAIPPERFKGITRSLLAGRIPLPKRILYYWFPKKYFDRIIHAEAGDAILITKRATCGCSAPSALTCPRECPATFTMQPCRHHLPPSCRRTASHPRPRIPPDELRPLRSGTLRNGMYRTILPLSRTPARQHRLRLLLLRPAQRPRRHAATPPHTP